MDRNELLVKILDICLDIFGVDIHENTKREDIDSWDSLGHLRLMMSIEQSFEVKFSMSQIPELDSIKKIVESIILLKK
ncbi:MAG: acyl carrier protein [Salinivirgaceae bacterium]